MIFDSSIFCWMLDVRKVHEIVQCSGISSCYSFSMSKKHSPFFPALDSDANLNVYKQFFDLFGCCTGQYPRSCCYLVCVFKDDLLLASQNFFRKKDRCAYVASFIDCAKRFQLCWNRMTLYEGLWHINVLIPVSSFQRLKFSYESYK